MRAVMTYAPGGPEVLVPAEIPVPEPGPGQVLLRVEACAVSGGETQIRAGTIPFPLPGVIGAEACGVIEAVGAGGDPALVGTRVVAVSPTGGSYAEFAAVDAGSLIAVPDGLSTVDALVATAPGAVATGLLDRADIVPGEIVLVEGGSGKVGGYLVRHAHEAGAHVIATAGSTAGRDRATALGADLVLDHTDDTWPDRDDVDVVFEMVGGPQAGRLLDLLADGGRMLLYGRLSNRTPELDLATVMGRGLRVIGCGGRTWYRQVFGTYAPTFLELLAAGRSHRQEIDTELPLADAAEAHRRIEAGTTNGRIILRP